MSLSCIFSAAGGITSYLSGGVLSQVRRAVKTPATDRAVVFLGMLLAMPFQGHPLHEASRHQLGLPFCHLLSKRNCFAYPRSP